MMLAATSANAQDWSAEVGLVSDYRYRGHSLSNSTPALQASLAGEHDSGLYAELWARQSGGFLAQDAAE